MEENEARIFYKNKITKTIYLISYVFLCLFGVVFSLVSGIGLIVENGKSPSSVYLYICLGFGLASLLMAIIAICLASFHREEGLNISRFNFILVLKIILRGLNLIGSLILLLGSFFGPIGLDANNEGWGNFIRIFAIFLLIVEGTAFLYSLWKIAWRKENPDRYAPGVISKGREKPKYTATKVEQEPKETKRKDNIKKIENKGNEQQKEVIKAIEVKDDKKNK